MTEWLNATAVLNLAVGFLLVCILLAMLFSTVRLVLGPGAQDRVLALDTMWMCGMLLALGLGLRHGSQMYFEIALLVALVGFASTVALTKFLLRGELIE